MHEVHMKELPLNGHLVLLHSQMHGTRQIKVEDGKQLLDITWKTRLSAISVLY